MRRFAVVPRGYDRGQVDALFVRIESALHGGGGCTADDVRASRFTVVLRGYDQGLVDEALRECIRQLDMRPAVPRRAVRPQGHADRLIEWIQAAEFGGAGLRTGYDVRDVDAFLDRVIAGLRGSVSPLTARDVQQSAFRTVRVGPGYDEHEVDRFLTQLASALEAFVPR